MIKLVTGAETAPVTLAQALRHLRALESDADMVWTYLQAATAMVEDYCGRSLVSKTFDLLLSKWPENGQLIELRRSPLVSITHVKYYADGSASQTTWDSSNYRVLTARLPGALEIVSGASLPGLSDRESAVEIRFVAGYGTQVSAIPAELRTAVLFWTQHLFDRRMPVEAAEVREVPMALRHLLRAFRVENQFSIP